MHTENRLTDFFDQIRIVNLSSREDRRREMNEQLENIGLKVGVEGVAYFNAVKPSEAAGFPTVGTRGCFLSHLQILKEAKASNVEQLLILEDDANFIVGFADALPNILHILQHWQWDICYLGHAIPQSSSMPSGFSYCTDPIMTSHAYAINGLVIPAFIDYLEAVLSREPGDPLGGPMHYDGAISMFRAQNPDIKTLVLTPPVVYQRPSRTDIHALAFYDRLPGLSHLANWARQYKARLVSK